MSWEWDPFEVFVWYVQHCQISFDHFFKFECFFLQPCRFYLLSFKLCSLPSKTQTHRSTELAYSSPNGLLSPFHFTNDFDIYRQSQVISTGTKVVNMALLSMSEVPEVDFKFVAGTLRIRSPTLQICISTVERLTSSWVRQGSWSFMVSQGQAR